MTRRGFLRGVFLAAVAFVVAPLLGSCELDALGTIALRFSDGAIVRNSDRGFADVKR
jgi:hypothetical protein